MLARTNHILCTDTLEGGDMTTSSDFGSWHAEGSVETTPVPSPTSGGKHANAREAGADQTRKSSPAQRRPASATTVRVPYLPSHVKIYPLRVKRPRSAASSYMRSTFAIDSALPARETSLTTRQQQQRRQRLLRGRASWQIEKKRSDEAKYVLQEGAGQNGKKNAGPSTVPPARQGFGVRTTSFTTRTYGGTGSGGREDRKGEARQRKTRSDRLPFARPASAPRRTDHRRPESSPARGRTAVSESLHRCKGTVPYKTSKRRPVSALARNITDQLCRHGIPHTLTSEQRRGSPLPPPAWGVRLATTSCATAGVVAASEGHTEVQRSFEEIVICRGRRKVVTGSAVRRQKAGGLGGEDAHSGRRDKWVGLLEGSSLSKLWACGGKNEPGSEEEGGAVASETHLLDLAVSPSPWGAFVGGPSTPVVDGHGKKRRPSSAPRGRSTAGRSPTDGFALCGDRVRARPRSAHAASASRESRDRAVSAESCKKDAGGRGGGGGDGAGGGGGGGGGDGNHECKNGSEDVPASTAEGGYGTVKDMARQSSQIAKPAQAQDRVVPTLEGIADGVAATGQADGIRISEATCQQEPEGRSTELVVVARQVHPSTIGSASKKRDEQKSASKKAGTPIVDGFRPRMAGTGPLYAPSPPSPAPQALPRSPPPPPPLPSPSSCLRPSPVTNDRQFLGLFGSALVPAGGGAEPPRSWAGMRCALQPWRQQERQPSKTKLSEGAKETAEDRASQHRALSQFAPVVLDKRFANSPGASNSNRRARAVGLSGKALRVPKRTKGSGRQQHQHWAKPSILIHGAPQSRGSLAAHLRRGNESLRFDAER